MGAEGIERGEMRFRDRLLGFLLVLLAVVLGANYFLVRMANERNARRVIDGDLRSAAEVFERVFALRVDQLRLGARLLSDDWAFRRLYGDWLSGGGAVESGTLVSALENYRRRMGDASFLQLAGEDGGVVAGTRGGEEAFPELIEAAEAEEDWSAVRFVKVPGGGIVLLVAVPLLLPEPAGWIVTGFGVDDRLALEFQRMTGVEVGFAVPRDGRATVLASSLGDGLRSAIEAGLGEPGGTGGVFDIEAGGDVWLGMWAKLPGGGSVVGLLQRSLSREMEPFRRLEEWLGLLTLLALGVSGVLAVWLARGISRPVADLSEGVGRIAAGKYDEPVAVRSRDELGRLAEAFNGMARGLEERDLVRDLLGRNVSPEIAAELIRRPAALGGEEREVTVLFTDIRGFTSLSESTAPTAILEFLNEYFSEVTRVIEAHSGVVDKYIGDAVMAVFGAPLELENHAEKAVECARALRGALREFNARREAVGLNAVHTGLGMTTGVVVAGVMGSETRHNYTFLGDVVNLAARLQDETKKFGVDSVISVRTVERCRHGAWFRPLGSITVRGKTAAVEVFTLQAD